MKKLQCKLWLAFLIALVLGVLLHFLYGWLPNPLTSLISPVCESLWEHLKILYFPLLLSALILTKGSPSARTARLLSLLLACGLMLGAAWLYHIPFRGESLVFDIALYVAAMALGFVLPRVLWPLGEWPGVTAVVYFLTILLGVMLVWFTFFPPEGVLFADLSGAVRTFLTIPV